MLGAGHAFDLPLVELARPFEKLVLVDIDAQALSSTVAGVFKDPGLRARKEPRVIDLTGVNGALVRTHRGRRGGAGHRGRGGGSPRALCRLYRLRPHRRACCRRVSVPICWYRAAC